MGGIFFGILEGITKSNIIKYWYLMNLKLELIEE
ncbi:hypothetical protein MOOR_06810 [Moorella thermoacetica]|uniref:Uncharacterized protein n=1 Tax=Neomoorella thermoacetica TaxID=1525 RepID=A0A1J5JZ83_NEOTH|nr:hypothetical protein MOOR_06810 [Moorella thermoacetica]